MATMDFYETVGKMAALYGRESNRRIQAVLTLVALADLGVAVATGPGGPVSESAHREALAAKLGLATATLYANMPALMPDPPAFPIGLNPRETPAPMLRLVERLETLHREHPLLDANLLDESTGKLRPSSELGDELAHLGETPRPAGSADDAGLTGALTELPEGFKAALLDLFGEQQP